MKSKRVTIREGDAVLRFLFKDEDGRPYFAVEAEAGNTVCVLRLPNQPVTTDEYQNLYMIKAMTELRI